MFGVPKSKPDAIEEISRFDEEESGGIYCQLAQHETSGKAAMSQSAVCKQPLKRPVKLRVVEAVAVVMMAMIKGSTLSMIK